MKHVLIHGLVSKPELNGLSGVVDQYVPSKDRFQVTLENGKVVLLKQTSLESLSLSPRYLQIRKPTRSTGGIISRMGQDILNDEAKKKKKKKKKKKEEVVPVKVWISDRSPRVQDPTVMIHGCSMTGQDPETGEQLALATTKPATHTAPSDPAIAIELPNERLLGEPMNFLTYGNYDNADVLSFDVPPGTAVGTTIDQRPENFLNVPTSWVQRQQAMWSSIDPNKFQWIGCSTTHKCEMFAVVEKSCECMYYNGLGARHKYKDHVNEMHHGSKLQDGCIYSLRPTLFIMYGTSVDDDSAGACSSSPHKKLTRVVFWPKNHEGHVQVATNTEQPDGTSVPQKAFTQDMNDPNIYLRAFLTAADCQDTGSLPGLFKVAHGAAMSTGRLQEFANAVDRLNVLAVQKYYTPKITCPGFERHPYPETAFGYYAFAAGEAHESAANLLSKASAQREQEELRLAILS